MANKRKQLAAPEDELPAKRNMQNDYFRNTQDSFPLMELPRELRNLVYSFHLESSCYLSLPSDQKNAALPYGGSDLLPFPKDWRHISEKVNYPGFYQPVFHEQVRDNVPGFGWLVMLHWQAREYATPELLEVKRSQTAKEAWELYSSKLLVDVDSINRFQTWCLHLDSADYAGITKLYVAGPAQFLDTVTPRKSCIVESSRPNFLIQLRNNGQELCVTSRFRLVPDQLAILQANLRTLLTPRTTSKVKFDGDDVLEAMFAFHNLDIKDTRTNLVVGALRKGNVIWKFALDADDLQGGQSRQNLDDPTLRPAIDRVRVFQNLIFHVAIGAESGTARDEV
jgi:hypothetical protein